MNKYEALFIFRPEKEKEIDTLIGNVTGLITKHKGKVEKEERWGRKPLAYPIKKLSEGIYYKVNFSIEPSFIKTLDASYKLNQDIVRTLIIRR